MRTLKCLSDSGQCRVTKSRQIHIVSLDYENHRPCTKDGWQGYQIAEAVVAKLSNV